MRTSLTAFIACSIFALTGCGSTNDTKGTPNKPAAVKKDKNAPHYDVSKRVNDIVIVTMYERYRPFVSMKSYSYLAPRAAAKVCGNQGVQSIEPIINTGRGSLGGATVTCSPTGTR
jgi:hypothetical protein